MEMKLFAVCFLFVSFCALVAAEGNDTEATTTEKDTSITTVTNLSTETTHSTVTTNTTTAAHSSTTAETTTKKNGSLMTLSLPLLVNLLPLFIILYMTRF